MDIPANIGSFVAIRRFALHPPDTPANAAGIAVVHSLFNIGAVLLLYPFGNQLVKLAQITIPEHADEKEQKPDEFAILDERFLEKPAFAVEQSRNAARWSFARMQP